MTLPSTASPRIQLPRYPGELWLDAVGGLWGEVAMRGYRLEPMSGPAPAHTHVVILCRSGETRMQRSIHGVLGDDRFGAGDLTLKSVQTRGDWSWDRPMDVLHLYIDPAMLERTATTIHGPGIAQVRLREHLKTRDEELVGLIGAIEKEVTRSAPGAQLMAEALQRQLAITLIRNHAELVWETPSSAMFSEDQRWRVTQYIATHLQGDLSVARLARSVGLSTDHFSRLFRASFDCAPHCYVMRMRLERACALLSNPSLLLVDIACQTGFADQSHLTRRFRREFGLSPTAWRATR